MDQRLFILGRESALKELLQSDPAGAGVDQDAHRLRDDVDDSRLGDRRHHLRDDERQARPREDDGRDAARLLRIHRVCPGSRTRWVDFTLYRFLVGLGIGGMFGAATTLVAESVPAAFRAMALGSLQALSALGNIIGSLVEPGDPARVAELRRRLRRLARAVLRRHPAGAAGRADHLRAQGAGLVAQGARRRRPRGGARRNIGSPVGALPRSALARATPSSACSSACPG